MKKCTSELSDPVKVIHLISAPGTNFVIKAFAAILIFSKFYVPLHS